MAEINSCNRGGGVLCHRDRLKDPDLDQVQVQDGPDLYAFAPPPPGLAPLSLLSLRLHSHFAPLPLRQSSSGSSPRTSSNMSSASPHLFPLNAPYPAPPLTCDLVLQHVARDATQLYLGRLLPELRPFVDRLLSVPRWHSARQVIHLDSHLSGPAYWRDYAVARSGERLVAGSRPRDWAPGMTLGEETVS